MIINPMHTDIQHTPHGQKATGALILPDGEGERIVHIADIAHVRTGEDLLFKNFGLQYPKANIEICLTRPAIAKDKKQEGTLDRVVLRGDIEIFYRLYQHALRGHLARLSSSFNYVTKQNTASLHAPGKEIDGKGRYLGLWYPINNNERPLKEAFDVYASPDDDQNDMGERLFTLDEALYTLSKGSALHGHLRNQSFRSSTDIYDAIEKKNYDSLSQWFIPPIELLTKTERYEDHFTPPYMETFYKDERFSFRKQNDEERNNEHRYLSSTFADAAGCHPYVMSVMHETKARVSDRNKTKHPVRLVRLEPRLPRGGL